MNDTVAVVLTALFPWPACLTYPLWFWAGHAWSERLNRRRSCKETRDD